MRAEAKPYLSWRYLLQEMVILLAMMLVWLLSSIYSDLTDFNFQLFLTAFIVITALAWLVAGKVGTTPVWRPMLAWLCVYFLSAAFSIDPRRSFEQGKWVILACFLFALVSDLIARGWPAFLFQRGLLVSGGVLVLFGWFGAVLTYQEWLKAAPGQWIPTITFRTQAPNIMAMFLVPLLMLVLVRLLFSKRRTLRLFFLLFAVATAGLLFLTSSRGGWLGAASGLAVLGALVLWRKLIDLRKTWRFLCQNPVVLVGVIVVGLVILSAGGYLVYKQASHPSHGALLNSRSEYWLPAWQTFLRNPILGQGPFTFASSYLQANSVPPKGVYTHAHSLYFNLLAETGLSGILAFGWMFISLCAALWKRLKTAQIDGNLPFVIAGVVMLAAVGVHALFDTVRAETLGMWELLVALAIALAVPAPAEKKKHAPYLLIGIIIMSCLSLWVVYPLHKAVEAANLNQTDRAIELFRTAAQRDAKLAVAHQQLGLSYSVSAQSNDPFRLGLAIAEFEETVQLDPSWSLNHANLGALYAANGAMSLAKTEFETAVHLSPDCVLFSLNLGAVLESNGDLEAANQTYQRVLSHSPGWMDAYFWRVNSFRQKVRSAWLLAHQPSVEPPIQILESELISNRNNATPYIRLAEAYLEGGRVGEADQLLKQAGLAFINKPQEILEIKWLKAEVAAVGGNFTQAVILGDDALNGFRYQGVNGPGSIDGMLYDRLVFRQPAMSVELVPQMVLITFNDFWGARLARLSQWYEQTGDTLRSDELKVELIKEIPDFKIEGY